MSFKKLFSNPHFFESSKQIIIERKNRCCSTPSIDVSKNINSVGWAK